MHYPVEDKNPYPYLADLACLNKNANYQIKTGTINKA